MKPVAILLSVAMLAAAGWVYLGRQGPESQQKKQAKQRKAPVEVERVGFRTRTRRGLEGLGSAAGRAVVGAGSEAMYSVSRLLMRIRRHGRAEPDTATVDVLGARYQQGQGEGAS